LFIILVAALIFYLILQIKPQAESNILQMFGLADFRIIEKTESSKDGLTFTKFVANKGTITVRVEQIKGADAANARQYIDEKRFIVESLYMSTPSPYPDVVTRTIECPDEFKPISNTTEQNDQESSTYILYANDRFTYGACSDEIAKYRAIFHLVYCKDKKEIYQIEYFIPKGNFSQDFIDKILNFRCN
jgi:hypothetical protein